VKSLARLKARHRITSTNTEAGNIGRFRSCGHLVATSGNSGPAPFSNLEIQCASLNSSTQDPESVGVMGRAINPPRKPQLGDRLMKGLCDQSSPQMGSVRQEGKMKEIRKGWTFKLENLKIHLTCLCCYFISKNAKNAHNILKLLTTR
jgi:hypothetical protein